MYYKVKNMKEKIPKEKYERGTLKKKVKDPKKIDIKWVVVITISALIISMILALISEIIIPNVYIAISIILIILFILLGVLFDIIGIAVATSDDKIFHSMATKKVKGSKLAINFIKKKEKVSSFCNDVIGDICGVVSGSCGLAVAIKLSNMYDWNLLITTILITSLISALTIGGKALGKSIAVNKGSYIVFNFAKVLNHFYKKNKN